VECNFFFGGTYSGGKTHIWTLESHFLNVCEFECHLKLKY